MASPRISEPRIYDPRGGTWLDTPREWTALWLVLGDFPPSELGRLRVTRQERPLDVSLRWIDGAARVVAEWSRVDAGRHRVHVWVGAEELWQGDWLVRPGKLGEAAFERLLDELTNDLPAEIALALSRAGAFTGLRLVSGHAVTLGGELERLRRVVLGDGTRPGVEAIFTSIARAPHDVLVEDRLVLPLERVRRPVPSRMACALTRGQDLLDAETPRRMMDGRRHRTLDTWENRVVLSLLTQCAQRLRWLRTRLRRPAFEPVLAELEAALVRARRPARALGDLPPLQGPVDRATMVLLRRPPYRAAFEALAALGRAAVVSLRAPGLDAPLDSVPALYQSWATLRVIARVLFHAASYGWDVWQQRLVRALRGEAVVELLRDNQSVLELRRGEVTVRIIPERRYHHAGSLQCLTEFEQRPDLSIERTEAEGVSVWLLDPKYKLDADDEGATRPLKSDVDKMHAYRDAIRGTNGVRAVRFAGVLYPGESVWWGDEIAALGAHPERRAALESDLDRMLGIAMA